MKNLIRFSITLTLLLIFSSLYSQQYPINVNVVVTPPFPQYVSDYMGVSKKVVITVQNTNFNQSYKIKLVTALKGNNGVQIVMDPKRDPLKPLTLKPGEVKTLTGNEIVNIYENYGTNDFTFTKIEPKELAKTQRLPEGVYNLCLRAYAYNSTKPLSPQEPMGCSQAINIQLIDPPIITYPSNESTLAAQNPQAVNFSWTSVTANIPGLRYKLKIIDITNLNINLYDAMESQNFLVYEEEGLIANMLFYGMSKPMLEEGREYAVQVQAYDQGGQQLFKNKGKSEIVTFTYGEDTGIDTTGGDPTANNSGSGNTDTTGQQTSTQSTPPANFNCAGGCDFDLTNIDQTPATSFQNGDILQIGNFEMRLTQAAWAGNKLSGEGVILPGQFLLAPIKVELQDVEVNANGRVFGGQAQAKVRQGSWMDYAWAEAQGSIDLETLKQQNQTPQQLYNNLTSSQYYMDQLDASMKQLGVAMPLGFGVGNYKLQIVGMHFYPDKATYNLFSMIPIPDDKDGEKYLSFGSKNLCINPAGPATSQEASFLYLANDVDVEFSDKVGLRILQGNVSTSQKNGTYLSFDCDGVHEVAIGGVVKMSNDLLIAEDASGNTYPSDTVSGWFQTTFTDWGDWVATVDFQNLPSSAPNKYRKGHHFQFKKLENYTFSVSNAILDHSDLKNGPGMQFPQSYTGPDKGNPSWQGVYFENLNVKLPRFVKPQSNADERIQVNAHHLLVDNSGLSGFFSAQKLVQKQEATVGDWIFTIDSLEVDIVQNSFEHGRMVGGLKLPITDSLVDYLADIDYAGNETQHLFYFETNESFNIPMWAAEANLDPNCSLNLEIIGNDVNIAATLHGDISLEETIDDVPGMNLKGIDFQDLVIENNSPYISAGYVGSNGSISTPKVAGFGIALEGIEFEMPQNSNIGGLTFDIDMDFTGNSNALSAGTKFTINNQFNFNATPWNVQFEGVDIEEIDLQGDLGVVMIDGRIEFFKEDPAFGKGFEGELTATFAESIQIQAQALFGNSTVNNQNLKYWFVSAQALFTTAPLPLVSPLDCYGFGGGAYYNLKQKTTPEASELDGNNGSLRDNFEVKEGNLGLEATIVVGLSPEPTTFNADATLGAEINTNTWGISRLSLEGNAYQMTPLTNRDAAMIESTVSVVYDFANKIFDLNAGVTYQVPPSDPVYTLSGNIQFYRDPNVWFFKAGEPQSRIGGDLELGKVTANLGAYFMMGNDLPPPTLPVEVKNFLSGYTPTFIANSAISQGAGFASGAKLDVRVDDINLVVCELNLRGIAGADVTVLDYSNMTCSGRNEFGVNKWYANGQAYLYVDATFTVKDYKAFACKLGAIVEAGLPNPTGVKGMAKAQFEIFGKDFDVEKSFTLGTICKMENVTVDGEPKIQPSPVEGLSFIKEITPADEATDVSLLVEPTIEFTKDVSDYNRFEISHNDGSGNYVTSTFRLLRTVKWTYDNGGNHEYKSEYDEDNNIYTFIPTTHRTSETRRMLDGNTRYKILAKVEVQELDQYGNWQTVTYATGDSAGEQIMEQKIHYFTTEDVPTYIDDVTVNFTKPYDRQRYFTQSDLGLGVIDFALDNQVIFDSLSASGYEFYAQFNPVNGGGSHGKTKIDLQYDLRAYFEIPSLEPETVYECRVIGVKEHETTIGSSSSQGSQSSSSSGSGGYGMSVGNNATYTFNQSGSINQQILQNNGNQHVMNLNGTTITLEEVVELYKIHFRTSQYNSLNDKINSMTLASATTATYGQNWPYFTNLSAFNDYETATLTFTGGERFDTYDVFGADTNFSGAFTGPGIAIYDGYGGGSCFDKPGWFKEICYDIYSWEPGGYSGGGGPPNSGGPPGNTQAGQAAQFVNDVLGSISYTPPINHSYNYFSGYTHIDGPLTDLECGITSNAGGFYAVLFPPTSGNEVMKFTWMGDLEAKLDWQKLENGPLGYEYDESYPPITSGSYLFKIKKSYTSNDNLAVPNPLTKEFNSTLNF